MGLDLDIHSWLRPDLSSVSIKRHNHSRNWSIWPAYLNDVSKACRNIAGSVFWDPSHIPHISSNCTSCENRDRAPRWVNRISYEITNVFGVVWWRMRIAWSDRSYLTTAVWTWHDIPHWPEWRFHLISQRVSLSCQLIADIRVRSPAANEVDRDLRLDCRVPESGYFRPLFRFRPGHRLSRSHLSRKPIECIRLNTTIAEMPPPLTISQSITYCEWDPCQLKAWSEGIQLVFHRMVSYRHRAAWCITAPFYRHLQPAADSTFSRRFRRRNRIGRMLNCRRCPDVVGIETEAATGFANDRKNNLR